MNCIRVLANEVFYSTDGNEVAIRCTIIEGATTKTIIEGTALKTIRMERGIFNKAFPAGVHEGKTFMALQNEQEDLVAVCPENWYTVTTGISQQEFLKKYKVNDSDKYRGDYP